MPELLQLLTQSGANEWSDQSSSLRRDDRLERTTWPASWLWAAESVATSDPPKRWIELTGGALADAFVLSEALQALAAAPAAARELGLREPPNQTALGLAHALLEQASRLAEPPFRIVPSADDGVAVWFRSGPRHAAVECYNTGEIAFMLKLSPRGGYEVDEIKPTAQGVEELVHRIKAFFAAAPWGEQDS